MSAAAGMAEGIGEGSCRCCHSGMVRRTRPGSSNFRVRCFASPRNDSHGRGLTYDNAGRAAGTCAGFGPHLVRITLVQDSTPSTTIEAEASTKKSCAVALWFDSHQPPVPRNSNRAVCAITGPITLAAPCDEKYIDDARPMKAYIGAAVDRY